MHLLHVGLRLQRGRYELLAPIGQGGSGSVWRAHDHRDGRVCALKLLPVPDGVPGARPEIARAAVAREEEVAARLQHPNACRVLGTFEDGGWACVVMELCARSLADRVEDEGPLPAEEALRVCDAVAAVLTAAHAVEIVHRDVKPQNVLLRDDDSVALSDWGLAHARSATGTARTTATTMLGTLPYLAPEVRVDPAAASPASDVYALGITLAWACTGRLPGDPYVAEVQEGLREELPESVYARVVGACDWAAEGRGWGGAGASSLARPIATRMAGVGSGGGGPPPPATPPVWRVDGLLSRSSSMAVVSAVAGLVMGAGLGLAVTWRGRTAWSELEQVAPSVRVNDGTDIQDCVDAPAGWTERFSPSNADDPEGLKEAVLPVAADVDGDGTKDLLWTHNLSAAVRVYWSAAGGPFRASPTDVGMDRAPCNVAVGDVNVDGTPDLVTASAEHARLALALGKGSRTFASAMMVEQAGTPCDVQLVDWQRDGRPDLLVRLLEPARVVLRENAGQGTFATHRDLFPASGPFAVAVRADGAPIAAAVVDDELSLYSAQASAPGFARTSRIGLPAGVLRSISFESGDASRLLVALSSDGTWTAADRVLRFTIDAQGGLTGSCRVRGAPRGARWLGHLDDDGVLDALGSVSGAYTTSSYQAWFGMRSPPADAR